MVQKIPDKISVIRQINQLIYFCFHLFWIKQFSARVKRKEAAFKKLYF